MRIISQDPAVNEQRVIIARFVRATLTMRSVDEIFSWVTGFLVQHFRAQVAQIWATQQTQAGVFFPALRSLARRDLSLPQHLFLNPEITAIAENTLRVSSPLLFEPVDRIFSFQFTTLLHQHGLNYYGSMFFSNPEVLLPAVATAAGEQVPTPLIMTLLLFFKQIPFQDEFLDMNDLFQKISPIARSRRLLLAAPAVLPSLSPSRQDAVSDLFRLIPHRNEDPADNPLASSVTIADEQVRRFYAAINDRRTVGELCILIHLEKTAVGVIVQELLAQSRIELYEPEGQRVERSRLFTAH